MYFLKKIYGQILDFWKEMWYKYIEWYSRNFRSLESFFISYGGNMREFKNNEELIEYLISKNLIINDKEQALRNIFS